MGFLIFGSRKEVSHQVRILNYKTVKTAVGNAGILNRIQCVPLEEYCCALTSEVMDVAVIDPTTLIVNIDPDTNEPFINPSEPEHFKNYNDVPRYDKIQFSKLQELCSFTAKSPTTRLLFDSRQLILDKKLQRRIDRFVSTELYKNPGINLGYFTRHHIVGDLYFEIKKTSICFGGGETHSLVLIAHNREIRDIIFFIHDHVMTNIIKNIGNLEEIKKIFKDMSGSGANNILECINKFEKAAADHLVSSASRFSFGSSNTAQPTTEYHPADHRFEY